MSTCPHRARYELAKAKEAAARTTLETAMGDYDTAMFELGEAQTAFMLAYPPYKAGDLVMFARRDGGVSGKSFTVKKVDQGCCVIGDDNAYIPFNQLVRLGTPYVQESLTAEESAKLEDDRKRHY